MCVIYFFLYIGIWMEWRSCLFGRELAKNGESDGDGRVEVGAGDVAKRINHDHHNQAPNHTNPWECYGTIDLVHHYGATPGKYHEVRSDGLCNDLTMTQQVNTNLYTHTHTHMSSTNSYAYIKVVMSIIHTYIHMS